MNDPAEKGNSNRNATRELPLVVAFDNDDLRPFRHAATCEHGSRVFPNRCRPGFCKVSALRAKQDRE